MAEENRTEQILIALTKSEKDIIEKAAEEVDRPVSNFCRKLIMDTLSEFKTGEELQRK